MSTNLVLERDMQLTGLTTRRVHVMPLGRVESPDDRSLKWLKCSQSGPVPLYLPAHLCDVYFSFSQTRLLLKRACILLWLGLCLQCSLYLESPQPASQLLLTKSHTSFRAHFTSLLIHILFPILPTGCDIYVC